MKLEIVSVTAAAALAFMASATAAGMPAEATKLGCVACHAMDKKLVGPSWKDIAAKYTGHGVKKYKYNGKEYPLIEGLVMKVSHGGSGNWGPLAMPLTTQRECTKRKSPSWLNSSRAWQRGNRSRAL